LSQGHSELSPKKMNLGSTISMLVSLVLHLSATLVLSWIFVSQNGSGFNGISIDGTQLDDSMNSELQEFEIATTSTNQQLDQLDQRTLELPDASVDSSNRFEPVSVSRTKTPTLTSMFFEEAGIAAAISGATEETNGGGGGAAKGARNGAGASFFGARAYGNRFVFVIDSSTSMIGPRWEALRVELHRALRSLSPDQEFFVISFDSTAHPMFNKLPPEGDFLKPTQDDIARLNYWVASIAHGNATMPASAIGIALRMEPDAIFLLSDGEIRDATLRELRIYNRYEDSGGDIKVSVPIHTVLLYSDVGYLTLKTIADENDGVFTPVTTFRAGR
jgi:hypothetical protein